MNTPRIVSGLRLKQRGFAVVEVGVKPASLVIWPQRWQAEQVLEEVKQGSPEREFAISEVS
jgi:hypothetical protein